MIDETEFDQKSFSWLDLNGQSKWNTWTPVFGSLTIIGAPTYVGRFRIIGRACEAQVKFLAATSIASVAGTDYLTLPFAAAGYSGYGSMTNDTTNIAVGLCHIDVSTSRCYLPAQVASANTFNLFLMFEV